MKTVVQRRGSVLMEFLLVFPIYLVLFGWVFAIGDMMIHSNRLAAGDVVNAFDVAGWNDNGAWRAFDRLVFDATREIDDRWQTQDFLVRGERDRLGCIYADGDGPWTVCACSRITDGYRLPGGATLGQLLSMDKFFASTLQDVGTYQRNPMLQTWEQGGRVWMRSKCGNLIHRGDVDSYCYYTLKRRRNAATWREGYKASGLLLNGYWKSQVAEEQWHDEDSIVANRDTCYDVPDFHPLDHYERYRDFVRWSD